MSHPRPSIAQRTRYFIGCEGESEQSYVRLVGNIAESQGNPIHLDPVLLRPGGGDPCALVELAARKLSERTRNRGRFQAQFILLDDDCLGKVPERDDRAHRIADEAGFEFIWQSTCHEALLLRHIDGCAALRPATTALAQAALRQRWPTYAKGMSAIELGKMIDAKAVGRAAQVEPKLEAFLNTINFQG